MTKPQTEVFFYVKLKGTESPYDPYNITAKAVGISQGKPSLKGDEIAVKVGLTVPTALFDSTHEVSAVVEAKHLPLYAQAKAD